VFRSRIVLQEARDPRNEKRSLIVAALPLTLLLAFSFARSFVSLALRKAERNPRQFRLASEPQREARPKRSAVVHIQSHSVDVVPA
jgi:hypothetical protein